jgi:hypothetical protein
MDPRRLIPLLVPVMGRPALIPAMVQGPKYSDGAASATVTFDSTPTLGNLLLAWGMCADQLIANASISGWTLAISAQKGSTSSIGLWYKVAAAGEAAGVTLNWTGATGTKVAIEEWSGVSVLDRTAKTDTTGGSVTSRSSGTTAATRAAVELCVVGVGLGNTVTSPAWSNSFTPEFALPVGGIVLCGGSRVVSARGTYESTLSWTTARVAGGLIATFRA